MCDLDHTQNCEDTSGYFLQNKMGKSVIMYFVGQYQKLIFIQVTQTPAQF